MSESALELQDILRRLKQLEDERAIVQTLRSFSVAADHGTAEEWVQWFAGNDAVQEIQGPLALLARFLPRNPEMTGKGMRFSGKEALLRFINGRNPDPLREQKHHTTYPLVEIDGDTARSHSYFLCTVYSEGRLGIDAVGRYVDRLVRCADGVWRLTYRLILSGPSEGPDQASCAGEV